MICPTCKTGDCKHVALLREYQDAEQHQAKLDRRRVHRKPRAVPTGDTAASLSTMARGMREQPERVVALVDEHVVTGELARSIDEQARFAVRGVRESVGQWIELGFTSLCDYGCKVYVRKHLASPRELAVLHSTLYGCKQPLASGTSTSFVPVRFEDIAVPDLGAWAHYVSDFSPLKAGI